MHALQVIDAPTKDFSGGRVRVHHNCVGVENQHAGADGFVYRAQQQLGLGRGGGAPLGLARQEFESGMRAGVADRHRYCVGQTHQ